MKRRPIVGLLPFYLKLYDDTQPNLRDEFENLLSAVVDGFNREGVEVVCAENCRIRSEFEQAIRLFEKEDVDLIVTLHLAYSPSLEAIDAVALAQRPILILDTTLDEEFGWNVDPARIMFNHGIHGVQDFACMLRRRKIPFEIVAGHFAESNVLKRASDIARAEYAKRRAAYAARVVKNAKVLRIGESFQGMGDFAVEDAVLQKALGIRVDQVSPEALIPYIEGIGDAEVEEEIRRDREAFVVELDESVHRRSVRIGLGLRRFLEQGGYSAFSMNFLAFNSETGPLNTVPFLEASKAMARGLGYAGEGDVLTAVLVAALNQGFGNTTFTEIFCPDWKGGSLFISHMGEVNPATAAEKPRLREKDFPWTPALNPAVITCAPAPGPATLVNLAPGPDETFRLIVAPVEVLEDTPNPALRDSVRGWIRPSGSLETFLEQYSRFGGTHHSALILGEHSEAVAAFAAFVGIEMKRL